mgnify:FL=1
MQKKTKNLKTIICIVLMLLMLSTTIVIIGATINGKTFNKYGGDYYTAYNSYGGAALGFGRSRSDLYFYGISYNTVKDYYFGFDGLANGASDYTQYIVNSPDGYCLNEVSGGTGSECFYVADIIDIDGNKIKFNKANKEVTGGKETLRMASAIYLKYAKTMNRDGANGYINRENMLHWMTYGGGWKAFYDKYSSYINDANVRSTYGTSDAVTYNGYVDNAIKKYLGYDYVNNMANYTALKDNNTTTPIAVTGEYTVNTAKYKTKIGPYSLQLNNGLTTKATGKSEDGTTYNNGIVVKENGYYYIYFSNEITSKLTELKVSQSYKGLKARLIVLGTGAEQARLIARAKTTDVSIDLNVSKMPLFETNVSLQKYIIKLNGEDLQKGDTKGDTVLSDRKNTYTASNETDERAKNKVSKSEESSMKENAYKKDENNIVLVEKGDTVTYRIYVYNNSDVTASEITVADTGLYYDENKSQYSKYTIEKITRDGANKDIKSQWTKSGTEYQYKIKNLAKNSSTYFDFTVKINDYEKEKILDNTAYIKGTVPQNKTDYRTADSDYIELVQYSTGVKKYIESLAEGNATIEFYRENMNGDMVEADPVLIEKGDKVTYKIKITNSSDVKTNVYVQDIISGFEYDNLEVSDWQYENGTGTLGKLTKTSDSNTLQAEGKMDAGATATCTVTMTVTGFGDSKVGKNTIKAWTEKHEEPNPPGPDPTPDPPGPDPTPDDPTPNPVPTIPEFIAEKKYLASLKKIVSSANEEQKVTGTGVSEERWDSWESKENVDNNAEKVYDKHNNPVTVGNGDTVTYTIRVKNDGYKEEEISAQVNSLKAQKEASKTRLLALIEKIRAGTITEESTEYKTELEKYTKICKELNALLEKCTTLKITEIEEKLPSGVEFVSCSKGTYENGVIKGLDITLAPQQTEDITVTVKVTESNMSLNVLKNEAKIKTIVNEENYGVEDLTPDNNNDADYIQLKDITIEGTVWNDRALGKTQDDYNGSLDDVKDDQGNDVETKLDGIKVYLYREGVEKPIAETQTANGGVYKFDASAIKTDVITHACERYIKAPYICKDSAYKANGDHTANYWKQNSYYSYYVVFEYDGITYTATKIKDESNCLGINNDNYNESNAKEDIGKVKETRAKFNERFSVIDNTKNIEYTTENTEGYIPESKHVYNAKTMSIQSSTEKITLSADSKVEEQIKHINLGLRGRDIFDLELTSDVAKVQVKVNNQIGTYEYANKVKVRASDIQKTEDMANPAKEAYDAVNTETDTYTQYVRDQELKASEKAKTAQTVNPYSDEAGLQEVIVTYKMTVSNASKTKGTATKVIDYYDSRYESPKAYILNKETGEKTTLSTATAESNAPGSNAVIINTPGTMLGQSETMDIYLELSLKAPRTTLASLLTGTEKIPTYNMAEVYQYKTTVGDGQTEYTRGLLDKDSAPGSVATETVRLTEGTSELTTLKYYFAHNELNKLKYEDDTYATPTLYYAIPTEYTTRKLQGKVFRDETTVDSSTRIKTGNGKLDDGEVGVYGATVELVEVNTTELPEKIEEGAGTVRYKTTTDKEGNYTFEKFLPGNYIVRYSYGDTKNTVVAYQSDDKKLNEYSYNGEDYQSTNNIGTYGAEKLAETTSKEWYAYNEKNKISTGTDNDQRREAVSTSVIGFNDTTMDSLNDLRDKKDISESMLNTIIDKTKMFASTPNFTLTVEKTETNTENKDPKQKISFSEYTVDGMYFGIAEVPISTIDLQKHVESYKVTDSAGENTIVEVVKDGDKWKVKKGNVLAPEGAKVLDTSIEEEKLQGAKLQITYNVSTKIDVQKDFRTGEGVKPTITSVADFIDNDLSYNASLGNNNANWEVKSADDVKQAFENYYNDNKVIGDIPRGTIDPEHKAHTSQVFAKAGNPILGEYGGECDIVLEKTLSAEETTVENIITSSINTYEYDNSIEILGLKYSNTERDGFVFRDRVRRPDKYIILPGTRHDSATSETITIHPPTGDTSIGMVYYIVGAAGLAVLAVGIFGIKKFVLKEENTKK